MRDVLLVGLAVVAVAAIGVAAAFMPHMGQPVSSVGEDLGEGEGLRDVRPMLIGTSGLLMVTGVVLLLVRLARPRRDEERSAGGEDSD